MNMATINNAFVCVHLFFGVNTPTTRASPSLPPAKVYAECLEKRCREIIKPKLEDARALRGLKFFVRRTHSSAGSRIRPAQVGKAKRELSNTKKLSVFKSVFVPILTYRRESW